MRAACIAGLALLACDSQSNADEPVASVDATQPEYSVRPPLRLPERIPNLTWLNKNECPLLPVIERELESTADVQDCGHLPVGSVNSMWVQAQACVLAAQRSARAFRLSAALPSYDSIESAGFVGRGGHHKPVFVRRSSTPVASWKLRATLHTYECERFVAREGCEASTNDLCLDCEQQSLRNDSCRKLETF